MVLTEILQNALEHGFVQDETGTVEVSAFRGGTSKEARLLVTVQDDGIGLPEGFDPHSSGNLGLQIVRTLVEGSWAAPSTWSRPPGAAPASSSTSRSGRTSSPAERARLSRPGGAPRTSAPHAPHASSPGPEGPGLELLLASSASGHCALRLGGGRCVLAARAAGLGLVRGGYVRRRPDGPGCGRRGASWHGARPR